MSTYIPHTSTELQEMLNVIGVKTIDELFAEIPNNLRLNKDLDIPCGMSELEMTRELTSLSEINKTVDKNVCFLGGGAYDHIIPAAIDHLLLRGDFFTAYTPYQPEVSRHPEQNLHSDAGEYLQTPVILLCFHLPWDCISLYKIQEDKTQHPRYDSFLKDG